jgi:hypothetical protein
MTVISVAEEYDFLSTQNYQSHKQSLISEGGHSYDRLDAERDGQSRPFYFLIDRVLAAEKALLKPKP